MNRFAFFRSLGEAVYRIDGAYSVFSRSAGIKPNMLWLLSALNDGQKHTQCQICWDWNFPRSTVNTLIKELERLDYVSLTPVPGSKRELYAELTEEGKAYAERVLAPVYAAEEALYKSYFSDHDTDFVEELNQFSAAMKLHFTCGECKGKADK